MLWWRKTFFLSDFRRKLVCDLQSQVPTYHCMHTPGGPLKYSLEGHQFAIFAMKLSSDNRYIISCSNKFITFDVVTSDLARQVILDPTTKFNCFVGVPKGWRPDDRPRVVPWQQVRGGVHEQQPDDLAEHPHQRVHNHPKLLEQHRNSPGVTKMRTLKTC